MGEEQKFYNVAFANTRASGGYEGIITWTTFKSKEEFDKWYTEDMKKTNRIVEEGITEERAIELTKQTSVTCRIAAAYQEAKNCSPEGEINEKILRLELQNVIFAVLKDMS